MHFHPTHRWGYLVPIESKHQREHADYGPLPWSDEVFGDHERYKYFKLPNPVRSALKQGLGQRLMEMHM